MTRLRKLNSLNLAAAPPKVIARTAGLRYGSDKTPGITRIRRGRKFRYRSADGRTLQKSQVKRIDELAIPPAWGRVWISPEENSHLQATGYDSRNRKQYLYHAEWNRIRNETKFHRLAEFGRALPKIRRRVRRDLRLPGLPREKVVAAVIRLLEQTRIRIGNERYAEENNSYGLSTMKNHHASVKGQRVEFKFRGKSGKFHCISLFDARLARIVRRCQDLPGHDLFEYQDDAGEIHKVSSSEVNEYLHAIAGQDFSAKDFRTWTATLMAAKLLNCLDPGGKKLGKARVIAAVDKIAEALGNTRAVCQKYYIHPAILDAALRHKATEKSRNGTGGQSSFVVTENLLLQFLKSVARRNLRNGNG